MITIEHLHRAYGDFLAVKDVGFSIARGEIAGLLGHNGAGKTTIMKMISGYLEPDSGRIEINGMDIARRRGDVQKMIGYLPETLPVYPEMTVADYLDYAANLKLLDGARARDEIRRVIRDTDIGDKLLAPIATLSRGYRQRVGVAQAILGRPGLLILDEPTNGLDPTQTQQMRDLIRELANEATVILSTHIMQEVDALCERVLVMRAGELALDARLDELRASNRLILASDLPLNDARRLLGTLDGVESVDAPTGRDGELVIAAHGDLDALGDRIARAVIENDHRLYQLTRERRDLEQVFREINAPAAEEVRDAA